MKANNYKRYGFLALMLVALGIMGAKFQTNIMKFGRSTAENLTIEFDVGSANNPKILWNNATSKLRFTNNGTTFFDLGSGSGGGGGSGVNLVANPGFEEGIGTTTTYKDAAAVSPVDGTGGSPTLTAVITTTGGEVLRGLQSLKVSKPASNTQGEGVAIPVSLEELDKGKIQQLSFDFKTQGNYAANDFRVYLIETTGPTVFTPIHQFQIPAGSGTFRTAVMTNTNASYRIVIHCATTSTSTSSFIIDNVSLGPNILPSANAVGTSIPFVGGGSWTTNTTYVASYDRNGRMGTFHYKVSTSGAPDAVVLTLNLPSGLTIDTSAPGYNFITDGIELGSGYANDSGSAIYPIHAGYDGTNVKLSFQGATSQTLQADVSSSGPFTFGSGDSVIVSFTVPIVQWTENAFLENTGIAYVCNSSLTDSSDTTSFVTVGPNGGCQFPGLTANSVKRVRSPFSLRNAHKQIEISIDAGANWIPVGQNTIVPEFSDRGGSIQAGMGLEGVNEYDMDVRFGTYRAYGNTYSGTGDPWTTLDADPNNLWRVVISTPVVSVGHDLVGQNKPGLVNGAGQLAGTATDDNACVGCVGEVIESIVPDVSAVSAASIADLTSIVLTPGSWLVQAHCLFSGNASVVLYTCGVSDVSATYVGDIAISRGYSATGIATSQGHTIDHWRRYKVAAGTTKTVYSVIDGNFTGTLQASGSLTAVRER